MSWGGGQPSVKDETSRVIEKIKKKFKKTEYI